MPELVNQLREYGSAVEQAAEQATTRPGSPANPRRGPRWVTLAAAAAVVAGLAAAVLLGRSVEHDVEPAVRPSAERGSAPTPVTPTDEAIKVVPEGPYAQGQRVTLELPEGYLADAINDEPRLCAVVKLETGGRTESCDPTFSTRRATEITSQVFTSSGTRDCREPEVTCRFVVRRADGVDRASAPLTFTGPPPELNLGLTVTPTDEPGTVLARLSPPADIEPDAVTDPVTVQVCAFGPAEEPTDPNGQPIWRLEGSGVLGSGCDWVSGIQIDASDLDQPFEVVVHTEFLGYQGWSDCRIQSCYLQVSGEVGVVDVAALLPEGMALANTGRPSLTIEEPGPYRADQTITVVIEGLPPGRRTSIGVCHRDEPWQCGYQGSTFNSGNGPVTFKLPAAVLLEPVSLEDCGPDRCYLELDSHGEGVPPWATTALPVSGPSG